MPGKDCVQTERRRSELNLMMAFTLVLEICVTVTELELPYHRQSNHLIDYDS